MTIVSSAVSLAEQLQNNCSILLELFRKKENFSSDVTVTDGRLVQLSSVLLDSQDRLWGLYSALVQCCTLMDKAIAKEDEELGNGQTGEYEKQRRVVKDRLSYLIAKTGELIRSQDSAALITPSIEVECPTVLFDLKLWVYRIYKELDYWAKMAISTFKALHKPPVQGRSRNWTTRRR